MNNLEVTKFKERLDALSKFLNGRAGFYNEREIVDWIADCTTLFYDIGIDPGIIGSFLNHFRSGTEEIDIKNDFGNTTREFVKAIGPFREYVISSMIEVHHSNQYELTGSVYYATIAFAVAGNELKNKIDEKRIVPLWLVEEVKKHQALQHVGSSLELIEEKYERMEADGLLGEANTLLGSILSLDPSLAGKSPGERLRILTDNEGARKRFGASKDLIAGLNSGRIVRNEKIDHKNLPLKYNLPFTIAACFTYLVLFFAECTILTGELIKLEKSSPI